jgi:hypothetical protein
MHLDKHSNIFFLEPYDVLTLGKTTYLHIVHSMFVSIIYYELCLSNLIVNVAATGLANLEKLEVGGLDR